MPRPSLGAEQRQPGRPVKMTPARTPSSLLPVPAVGRLGGTGRPSGLPQPSRLLVLGPPLVVVFIVPFFIVFSTSPSSSCTSTSIRTNCKTPTLTTCVSGARKTLAKLWEGQATIWHGECLPWQG
ncbi:hypothetical protein J4Q44_G00298680 [Coregonus suidteri]|uniref:Uncharacterized protein n=1 Tax=Coregonus suidteri TaxID=861788 RepID=A0AAN8L288_9TELE